jgi:hypothetical protein
MFICHIEQRNEVLEQMRPTVRLRSYYSENKFACHVEQINGQNISEQLSV